MSINLIDIRAIAGGLPYPAKRKYLKNKEETMDQIFARQRLVQTFCKILQVSQRSRRRRLINQGYDTRATCTVMLSGPPCSLARATNARQAAWGVSELSIWRISCSLICPHI